MKKMLFIIVIIATFVGCTHQLPDTVSSVTRCTSCNDDTYYVKTSSGISFKSKKRYQVGDTIQ